VLKFANPQQVTFTNVLQIIYTVVVPPNAPSLIGVAATGGTTAFLVGRVDGAANQAITLQTFSAGTCVLGTLVGGVAGGTITTTTDPLGYFGGSVAGVNPGAFVTVQVTSPTASPASSCLVSSRDNDSWPKAFLLEGSAPKASDFIDAPGKARWYKFAVTPGQRIEVKLSGLRPTTTSRYSRTSARRSRASSLRQRRGFGPPEAHCRVCALDLQPERALAVDLQPVDLQSGRIQPVDLQPSIFSPSIFSPSIFSPSILQPVDLQPVDLQPIDLQPIDLQPSIFSPSIFSPSILSTTEIAQAFSTAQMRSVIAVSATAGTSDEFTVVNTWNRTDTSISGSPAEAMPSVPAVRSL
jgi:hypothetical protein